MPLPVSLSSIALFLAVCSFVILAMLRGVWRGAFATGGHPPLRTLSSAAGVVLALGIVALLVKSGWVESHPPHLIAFGGGCLLNCLLFGLSPIGRSIAMAVPVSWLLAFQGFRLPLELVLHSWFKQGILPETMTWTGSNLDIIFGILALVLAPFAGRSIRLAWLGNVLGLAFLLNVIRVAALSSSAPFAWRDISPRLILPYHLPYALIIPICVGGALAGHVILTRALLRKPR